MFIYLKHIFNSIKRKPAQPIIIIATIAIAVAIFLASLAVKDVFANYSILKYKASAGDTDISINVSSQSQVRFMEILKVEELLEAEDKAYGIYTITSIFNDGIKNYTANIYATALSEVNDFNPMVLKEFSGIGQSQINNKIIISEAFAVKHNVKLDDEIYLKIVNTNKRYEVAGIAENTGLFFKHDILANDESINDIIWSELGFGLVDVMLFNKILIKVADKTKIDEKIATLKESIYLADKNIVLSDRGSDTLFLNAQGQMLVIIALLVGILAIVIVYSSIVLLMGARVDAIAIFKSVGATKPQMNFLLFLELVIYGTLGTLIGLLLSDSFLVLLTNILNITGINLDTKPIYYLYMFFFGFLLVITSGMFQVFKTTNKSLRELLVGFSKTYALLNYKILIFLFLLIAGLFTGMYFLPLEYVFIYNLVLFVLVCVVIAYILPYIFLWIFKLIEKIFTDNKKSGLVKIVSRSNKRNKSILNTNRLFVFSLVLIMLVVGFVSVIKVEINRLSVLYVGDIHIQNIADPLDATYNSVEATEGVVSASKYLFVSNCLLSGGDNLDLVALKPTELNSVINESSFDFTNREFSGNGILIPLGIMVKNNLKIGQEVSIDIGRDRFDFIISGYFDSPLMIFIADIDYLGLAYNGLSVKAELGKTDEVYQSLIMRFSDKPYIFLDSHELNDHFVEALGAFIKLFDAFLLIVALTVIIGFVNNAVIAMQERKEEFKIMWQNGMSRRQFIKLNMLESGFNIIGSVMLALLSVSVLLEIIIVLIKPMGLYFTVRINPLVYILVFSIGIVCYLLISFILAYFYKINKVKKEIY